MVSRGLGDEQQKQNPETYGLICTLLQVKAQVKRNGAGGLGMQAWPGDSSKRARLSPRGSLCPEGGVGFVCELSPATADSPPLFYTRVLHQHVQFFTYEDDSHGYCDLHKQPVP